MKPPVINPNTEGPPQFNLVSMRRSEHVALQASEQAFFSTHEIDLSDTFGLIAKHVNDWMRAQGFWESRNTAEKLMLIVTEVAEACEGQRAGLPDNATGGLGEELADIVIRVLDLAGEREIDLGRFIARKMIVNVARPRKHGKAY